MIEVKSKNILDYCHLLLLLTQGDFILKFSTESRVFFFKSFSNLGVSFINERNPILIRFIFSIKRFKNVINHIRKFAIFLVLIDDDDILCILRYSYISSIYRYMIIFYQIYYSKYYLGFES